ncbi:MAG: FISUMP domain-containing protein, partial [Candidatus Moraniibacteriota bacterium]
GALSPADWNIFNNKQPAGSYLTANQNIILSGDVTGSGATAITTAIGNDKITESMLKESTGAPANSNILTYNGATQGFAWVATAPATSHNLFSSSHADMAAVTPIQGDIIYYTGTQWTTLGAGTNGNFLRTNGTGAVPSWQTAVGTTYTAAANNLLQLSSNEFSVRQGTMTDTKLCTYTTASGLVCDTSASSFTHNPATINSTANGLSIDGSQQISLALSSTSTTGVLSSTDWNIFNSKQPAGSYLTSFTELDPRLPVAGTNGNLLQSNGSAWTSWTPNFLTGTKVDSFNTRTGAVTLTGTDVTNALAFTPYNTTNPSNYLSTVDISANTNLAVSGTLLRLTGDTLSLKEGLLTSGKLCIYDGTNLVCDTSSASVGHTPATISVTPNGLSIDSGQLISLALASTSATGALSPADWNIFNNKQPAGSYLTSFTETDPVWLAEKTNYSTKTVADGLYLAIGGTAINSALLENHNASYFQTALGFTPYNATNPAGYISSYTETDPIFLASSAHSVTASHLTILGNTSGTNTGDNAINTLYSGLASSKQDALSGTGFVKITGTTISYDNSTYVTASSLHNAVTLGTSANGLSLSTQELSLGLASTSAIGALSNTDWNTFSGKQNNLGFTPYNSTNPNSYVSFATILTLDGTGSGLDADKLDGFDSSAFGDATAANQTTIMTRIGTNGDASSMSSTLFAGQHMLSDVLGTNDANNAFDSSAVVANADGSVLERLESIQSSSGFVCNRDTVRDSDGNYYRTISVGTQCWMNENLRTGTMLASGATMPTNNGIIEKWCYGNDIARCNQEGGFYHWDEAMAYSTTEGAKGICPTGWHIPTDAEQYTMEKYLTDAASTCDASRNGAWDCTSAGTKLKSGGTSGMNFPLAGRRVTDGSFDLRTAYAYVWSSSQSGTNAWSRVLDSVYATVLRNAYSKAFGFSVRCLKD